MFTRKYLRCWAKIFPQNYYRIVPFAHTNQGKTLKNSYAFKQSPPIWFAIFVSISFFFYLKRWNTFANEKYTEMKFGGIRIKGKITIQLKKLQKYRSWGSHCMSTEFYRTRVSKTWTILSCFRPQFSCHTYRTLKYCLKWISSFGRCSIAKLSFWNWGRKCACHCCLCNAY